MAKGVCGFCNTQLSDKTHTMCDNCGKKFMANWPKIVLKWKNRGIQYE